jgi:multidrug resistance efflux pump
MKRSHAQTEERALVPASRQLAFSGLYSDDRTQRQAGLLILAILLGGILAWCLTAPIADGIRATATVTIAAEREVVTHPHGGTVGELLVGGGDAVDRGQVLLRLDSADIEEALERIGRERNDTLALQSRLLAGPGLEPGASYRREATLLAAKLAGLAQQLDAQTRLRELYADERTAFAPAQPASVERQPSLRDMDQRLARQDALIADLETRIASARLEQLAAETDDQRRREAERQLSEAALAGASQKLQRLDSRRRALAEALQATIVVAPLAGRVELAPALATGTTITAGEPVLSIRPHAGGLVVTANIRAATGLRLQPGSGAKIRILADEAGEGIRLAGEVSRVSPPTDAGIRTVTVRIPAAADWPTDIHAAAPADSYPAEIFFDAGERTPARRLLDRLERR